MSVSIPSFRLTEEKKEKTIAALKTSKEKLEHTFTELNINDIDFFAKSFQSQPM
jgi:IclR family KDG regulon transcriptional repressor